MTPNSLSVFITQRHGDQERSLEMCFGPEMFASMPIASSAVANDVRGAIATPSRFTKLDAKYWPLPADAKFWHYVRDNQTGLVWFAGNVLTKGVSWKKADAAARELGDGWRLPTRAELLALVDDTRHSPAIDADFFVDTKNEWYWTSTAAASSAECAWIVGFNGGYADYLRRDGSGGGFVRAVRSAVPAGQ